MQYSQYEYNGRSTCSEPCRPSPVRLMTTPSKPPQRQDSCGLQLTPSWSSCYNECDHHTSLESRMRTTVTTLNSPCSGDSSGIKSKELSKVWSSSLSTLLNTGWYIAPPACSPIHSSWFGSVPLERSS